MSALRNQLDDYLAVRRALGFKLERAGRLLPDFVTYLEHHRACTVTTGLALAWAKQPPDGHPAWWTEKPSMRRPRCRPPSCYPIAIGVRPLTCTRAGTLHD